MKKVNKLTLTLGVASLSTTLLASSNALTCDVQKSRPNILFIQCDQLAAMATKIYSPEFADTPNIDKLFEKSSVYSRAYTVCPLCMPARAALWTSRYPHETNVVSNVEPSKSVSFPTIGETFSNAGYQTVHLGKKHDAGTLRGFEINIESKQIKIEHSLPVNYDTFLDVDTTNKMTEYLTKSRDKSRPFLAVADFHNPHNVCQFIGENEFMKLPDFKLPELPPNFECSDWDSRPISVRYIYRTHPRQRQAMNWSDKRYQYYLYAYSVYVNMVDKQIGQILQALEDSGEADNTIILLTADHGDNMAAFKLVTKHIAFYENAVNIPLSIYDPRVNKGSLNKTRLVSNLDFFPTLCDYAGIKAPEGVRGTSLLQDNEHKYIVSEWISEYFNLTAPGRMLVDNRYKYINYLEGNSEELYDLKNDPYELNNLAKDAENSKLVEQYRNLFKEHVKSTNDPYFSIPLLGDKKYRQDAPQDILDAITEGRLPEYENRSRDYERIYSNHYFDWKSKNL